ncbi:MAG: serine hydrolase domain-containing protein, partial [Pseudomonadota bacterium]
MSKSEDLEIHGTVAPAFEVVRTTFAENLSKRGELGGAVCVYHQGEKVVDLWGGIRDAATGGPWEEDTMVVVYSLTKGMAAMTLALAHSRGLIDYDARVADYWPEFAQNGKEGITVRQLLAHQAGLHAFHQKIDKDVIADLDRLAKIMAQETPAWPLETRNAYHFLSLGFYEGELIRRVDPEHRTLGQFFQEEIATPLDLEFYIGLPNDIPNARLARLQQAGLIESIIGLPLRMALAMINPWSHSFRACIVNPGGGVVHDKDRIYARNLEVPSGGGVGTARAIAKAYSAFA